jgi:F-type H+-transporting ATPase subunit a
MNIIRPLLALVAVVLPIWFATGHVAHHSVDSPFLQLHSHLNPERLIYPHGHGDHDDADGSHAGETAEEHAAHAGADEHDEHAGETAEEHAAHAGADAHDGHAGHGTGGPPDYVFHVNLPESMGFFDMDPDWVGNQLILTNLQLFQLAAAALLLICFMGVPKYIRTGKGDYTSKLFAGFCGWVRDEMVYPVMGKETGSRFLPLFLTIFFFILFMNFLGLVPGSATATANVFVTGGLATVVFAAMLLCGMAAQGPIAFWKNLVPHVPTALWPLMFLVEVVGLCIKPFALMIRLFANMSGGHLVVLSFMGLIFFFSGEYGDTIGWIASPVALGFAVFIMIIEFFVAMLQAYVFTQLSILFVHSSVHPEH